VLNFVPHFGQRSRRPAAPSGRFNTTPHRGHCVVLDMVGWSTHGPPISPLFRSVRYKQSAPSREGLPTIVTAATAVRTAKKKKWPSAFAAHSLRRHFEADRSKLATAARRIPKSYVGNTSLSSECSEKNHENPEKIDRPPERCPKQASNRHRWCHLMTLPRLPRQHPQSPGLTSAYS
jgi:hypothetical protein